MALHWDLSKVEDSEALTEGTEWSITEAIIWMTMSVGLQGITEDNVDEFVYRSAFVQAIYGPWLSYGIYVTESMVRRRVGLFTNVSDEKRNAWMKRQMEGNAMARLIRAQQAESDEIIARLEAEDAAKAAADA
jgi:hypothetical protein